MIARRSLLAATGASLLLHAGAFRAWAHNQSDFDGEWNGVLDAGGAQLRVRLVVEGENATLYSIDQDNAVIPADSVNVSDDEIDISFAAAGASFKGQLRDGSLVGEWSQSGAVIPLTFKRGS